MTGLAIALLAGLIGCLPVAGFALGAFLALYGADKISFRRAKHQPEEKTDKLTIEDQVANLMNYTGRDN